MKVLRHAGFKKGLYHPSVCYRVEVYKGSEYQYSFLTNDHSKVYNVRWEKDLNNPNFLMKAPATVPYQKNVSYPPGKRR